MKQRGFTLIEVLLVIAIIGVLLMVSYPNIKSSLEVRNLENEAREILTTLQQAKFQAVKTKLNHRITFDNTSGTWVYYLEREVQYNIWLEVPGYIRRSIPSKYTVTVSLPNQQCIYSPLGMVLNYSTSLNSISIQNPTLSLQNQPSTRTIMTFAGGSVQYIKST
ncbi:MAG: GspH/FimT family pseudopilin [Candidatus Aminicenantales bacterium]